MQVKFDHILLQVPDLEKAVRDFEKSGFKVYYGQAKTKKNYNAMIYFSDESFIELIDMNSVPLLFKVFLKSGLGGLLNNNFARLADYYSRGYGLIDFALYTSNFSQFVAKNPDKVEQPLNSKRTDQTGTELKFSISSYKDLSYPFFIDDYQPRKLPDEQAFKHSNLAEKVKFIYIDTNKNVEDLEKFYRELLEVDDINVSENTLKVKIGNTEIIYNKQSKKHKIKTIVVEMPGGSLYASPLKEIYFSFR